MVLAGPSQGGRRARRGPPVAGRRGGLCQKSARLSRAHALVNAPSLQKFTSRGRHDDFPGGVSETSGTEVGKSYRADSPPTYARQHRREIPTTTMMMRTKTKRTKTSPTNRRSSANPTKTSRLGTRPRLLSSDVAFSRRPRYSTPSPCPTQQNRGERAAMMAAFRNAADQQLTGAHSGPPKRINVTVCRGP